MQRNRIIFSSPVSLLNDGTIWMIAGPSFPHVGSNDFFSFSSRQRRWHIALLRSGETIWRHFEFPKVVHRNSWAKRVCGSGFFCSPTLRAFCNYSKIFHLAFDAALAKQFFSVLLRFAEIAGRIIKYLVSQGRNSCSISSIIACFHSSIGWRERRK